MYLTLIITTHRYAPDVELFEVEHALVMLSFAQDTATDPTPRMDSIDDFICSNMKSKQKLK